MRLVLLFLLFGSAASAQVPCTAPDVETPHVAGLLATDVDGLAHLRAYACRLGELGSTHDLLDAMVLRDSVAAHLGRKLEHASDPVHEWGSPELEALFAELERLALRPTTAEGFVTGVAVGPFSPEVVAAHAPEDLALYLAFRVAEGESYSGEYPFLDLRPQIEMVRLGERLRALVPSSPYVASTQDAFLLALAAITSLHTVRGEPEEASWLTGVGTVDYWPYAADGPALARIVEEQPDSRYAPLLKRILESPPVIDPALETSYVVVAEAPDFQGVTARYAAFLDGGVDVVGWLVPSEAGQTYAVVYRYYPTGFDSRVDAAVEAAEALGLMPTVQSRPAQLHR